MRRGSVVFCLLAFGGVARAQPASFTDHVMAPHRSNAARLKAELRKLGAPPSLVARVDRQLALAEQRLTQALDPTQPDVRLSQKWRGASNGMVTSLEVSAVKIESGKALVASTDHSSVPDRSDQLAADAAAGFVLDNRSTTGPGAHVRRAFSLLKADAPGPDGRTVTKGSWLVETDRGRADAQRYLIEAGRVTRLSARELGELFTAGRTTP